MDLRRYAARYAARRLRRGTRLLPALGGRPRRRHDRQLGRHDGPRRRRRAVARRQVLARRRRRRAGADLRRGGRRAAVAARRRARRDGAAGRRNRHTRASGLAPVGNVLIRVWNPDAPPDTWLYDVHEVPGFDSGRQSGTPLSWTGALVLAGSFVYLLGSRDTGLDARAVLARLEIGDLASDDWQPVLDYLVDDRSGSAPSGSAPSMRVVCTSWTACPERRRRRSRPPPGSAGTRSRSRRCATRSGSTRRRTCSGRGAIAAWSTRSPTRGARRRVRVPPRCARLPTLRRPIRRAHRAMPHTRPRRTRSSRRPVARPSPTTSIHGPAGSTLPCTRWRPCPVYVPRLLSTAP